MLVSVVLAAVLKDREVPVTAVNVEADVLSAQGLLSVARLLSW